MEWERPQVFPILDGVLLRVGQAYPDRHELRSPYVNNLFFAGDTARQGDVVGISPLMWHWRQAA